MTGRRTKDELEKRLAEVRVGLRARHAAIEPDAHFSTRVIARLPRDEAWSFAWAVRRTLPASIALAMLLGVAVAATGGFAKRQTSQASSAPASRTVTDPLDWLLEGRQELR